MPKTLVTGATGFIGSNVVRALLKAGKEVKGLLRPTSNRKAIDGLDIELAYGDLRDRDSLVKALKGCDRLYHVAALYVLWARDPKVIYACNVEGTKNMLSAALERGVEKVVYTSTAAALGNRLDGGLTNEETEFNLWDLADDYVKSKVYAERQALEFYEQGLPVVVVNPSGPIGPWDVKPTPTGAAIVHFLNRNLPGYVDGIVSLVDVEDVAVGHLLAAEKGRPGERYILSTENLTVKTMMQLLEEVSGTRAPRLKFPTPMAMATGYLMTWISNHITKRPPLVTLAAVDLLRSRPGVDASKAVRELGFPQTPIRDSLQKAVEWFRQHGYVKA